MCSLPVIEAEVEGCTVRALVDSGCETTVVGSCVVSGSEGASYMEAFDGSLVRCLGRRSVQMVVRGYEISIDAVIADKVIRDVDVILGMNAIDCMGGVTVRGKTAVFGVERDERCCAAMERSKGTCSERESDAVGMMGDCVIDDKDFKARFDGEKWTVEWVWKADPQIITNAIASYENRMQGVKRQGFEEEVERWISEGILQP